MRLPLYISGPTGVGKTEIALKISKKYNLKMVSCDSIQIYKEMDIGSNKYKENTDLIDILDFYEKMDVEKFIKYAQNYDKNTVFVGVTSFYIERLGIKNKIFLYEDREYLYRKLDYRCEKMIQNGFLREVMILKNKGLSLEYVSGRSIGYRSALILLEKGLNIENFYDFLEDFKSRTRNSVRRHETYAKNKNYIWININDNPLDKIIDYIEGKNIVDKYEQPNINNFKKMKTYKSINLIYNNNLEVNKLINELKIEFNL